MKHTILLFASARELAGQTKIEVELDAGADVSALKHSLAQQHPALAEIVGKSAVSIDQEFAPEQTIIGDSAELALIPPVSGG